MEIVGFNSIDQLSLQCETLTLEAQSIYLHSLFVGVTPLSKPPAHLQKQFSAAPVISKPKPEEDDVLATLMKYEKEVKMDKKRKPEDSKLGRNNGFEIPKIYYYSF